MQLSELQKQKVREWVSSGASLSDVQKNLKTDFGITMTFIDVRLLVLDLGASIKDKPEPKPATKTPSPCETETLDDEEPLPADEPEDEARVPDDGQQAEDDLPEEQTPPAGTSVSLTLDSLVVPGAMVSGNVTFSDGNKARWLIDQYGRFGIDPVTPGYRPSPQDLHAFQLQLRDALQRKGYM